MHVVIYADPLTLACVDGGAQRVFLDMAGVLKADATRLVQRHTVYKSAGGHVQEKLEGGN